MKHPLILVMMILISSAFIFSCGNSSDASKEEIALLRSEVDSLLRANASFQQSDSVMSLISACLDSVAYQEELLIRAEDSEGHQYTKVQILDNIRKFREIIAKYQSQIAALQDSVAGYSKLQSVVSFLKEQMAKKNEEIAQLQTQITNNETDIKSLLDRNHALTKERDRIQMEKEMSDDVIEMQEEIINQGYYIVGTKKELKAAEVLTGGFLKKKKVDVNNLSDNNFTSINIQDTKEIKVNGKSPKILSQMPEKSYHWDGTTLVIDNVKTFWSVTRYLIIQVN